MEVFCGIDWAESHHDVAVVDAEGRLLARRRIRDDAAGYQQLLQLLAEAGDTATDPIPVAIETSRGLLVAFLRATGRRVYAINPLAVSRYRDRHGVAGAKSDHGDAVMLAGILRTDQAAHRPLPADSELAQAITVLARAQQDAVWNRQPLAMKLRSLLREFFPAALAAFQRKHVGLTAPQARAVLAAAPTPTQAASLTTAQLRRLLRHAGRQRNLGELTGARVLAELGDDRSRFADARGIKAYAGAAPVTRASGKRLQVLARRVKNQRLAAVGYLWAFAALTASPGARTHYDRRKHAGDHHAAAQRNLFNRLLGMLHHCLATRQTYSEAKAFPALEARAA